MAERGVQVLDDIYRRITEIRRDGRKPQLIRIGAEDWYDIVAITHPYTGPLSIQPAATTLFGVPLKRLPFAHVISVI